MPDPLRSALESATDGAYRIERELGRGGMGAVFLAEDLTLRRMVAIKMLPPDLATNSTLRERFVREARLAASLSHPNIVHVHAVIEKTDVLAIVMQFVDGETLTQRIERSGRYDPSACARLLQDIAWALGYAHARGIIHRDVKPDNLLIERGTGRPMILDFGIARQERAGSLTEVGQSIGTPHYMSPEQSAAEDVDGRSDLYSLGCVGFFAATGRTVFEAEAAHRLLILHLTQPAPDLTTIRPEFPRPLAEIIARALAKGPEQRFESGEAMAEAIGTLQLRSREVAPLLRLFHQQTSQSVQTFVVILLVFGIVWWLAPEHDQAMRMLIFVVFATILLTIVSQTLDRVRFVVRQGFGAADVDSAVTSIVNETAQARAQLLADPIEARRARRRHVVAFCGMAFGVSIQPIALGLLRDTDRDGPRAIPLAVFGLMVAGAAAIGFSLALWAMRPIRITLAQRVGARLLRSRLGRAVFARAERRYARDRASDVESAAR